MKKGTVYTILGGIVGAAVAVGSAIIGHKKNSSSIACNDDNGDYDDYVDSTCKIEDDETINTTEF